MENFISNAVFQAETLDNYYQCLYLSNVSVLKNPEHTNLPRLISTLFHHVDGLLVKFYLIVGKM